MLMNHEKLQRLTVSSPQLDNMVESAMQVGALGAKLSGGGRGGNMIALVSVEKIETIQQALYDSGAKNSIYNPTDLNHANFRKIRRLPHHR